VTNYDLRHCHKWAELLVERKAKLKDALCAINKNDFDGAKKLVNQIFTGVAGGKQADPGMAGSLLYHMAMVTKMESEPEVVLQELNVNQPNVTEALNKIYTELL
jgi:hypothetical protein